MKHPNIQNLIIEPLAISRQRREHYIYTPRRKYTQPSLPRPLVAFNTRFRSTTSPGDKSLCQACGLGQYAKLSRLMEEIFNM